MNKKEFKINEIIEMLPHRYPFLLVDRVFDIDENKNGKGEKLYTFNEWFFQGHFPNNPIVPGVLLIESAAQIAAVIYQSQYLNYLNENSKTDVGSIQNHVGYLCKTNVKFLKVVRPGDTVITEIKFTRDSGNMSIVEMKASVNKGIVAQGELVISKK